MAASGCLYMSGMVLNDWFDIKQDSQQRPERPIPSSQISLNSAFSCYVVLTVVGILLSGLVSTSSLICAVVLVIAIVAYNGLLKRTLLAPVAMGLCRTLNILLGASFGRELNPQIFAGFEMPTLWVAISLGVFITGLTWFARDEATGTNRLGLVGGTVVMFAGIVGYVLAPLIFEIAASEGALTRYIAIVALISLPILLRSISALLDASPQKIGFAISTSLRSLILFDAAIAYLFSQCQVIYPLAILLLLIPSLFLARWISPT